MELELVPLVVAVGVCIFCAIVPALRSLSVLLFLSLFLYLCYNIYNAQILQSIASSVLQGSGNTIGIFVYPFLLVVVYRLFVNCCNILGHNGSSTLTVNSAINDMRNTTITSLSQMAGVWVVSLLKRMTLVHVYKDTFANPALNVYKWLVLIVIALLIFITSLPTFAWTKNYAWLDGIKEKVPYVMLLKIIMPIVVVAGIVYFIYVSTGAVYDSIAAVLVYLSSSVLRYAYANQFLNDTNIQKSLTDAIDARIDRLVRLDGIDANTVEHRILKTTYENYKVKSADKPPPATKLLMFMSTFEAVKSLLPSENTRAYEAFNVTARKQILGAIERKTGSDMRILLDTMSSIEKFIEWVPEPVVLKSAIGGIFEEFNTYSTAIKNAMAYYTGSINAKSINIVEFVLMFLVYTSIIVTGFTAGDVIVSGQNDEFVKKKLLAIVGFVTIFLIIVFCLVICVVWIEKRILAFFVSLKLGSNIDISRIAPVDLGINGASREVVTMFETLVDPVKNIRMTLPTFGEILGVQASYFLTPAVAGLAISLVCTFVYYMLRDQIVDTGALDQEIVAEKYQNLKFIFMGLTIAMSSFLMLGVYIGRMFGIVKAGMLRGIMLGSIGVIMIMMLVIHFSPAATVTETETETSIDDK